LHQRPVYGGTEKFQADPHWREPHGKINERNLSAYSLDTLFVVYCGGPHCNGADRGAANLARLGRKVKKMIGGVEGWKDEGFDLVKG
jgi:rhodanese-related sulfurtransferase